MARPSTAARVFAAVVRLAERGGPNALTMEGVATEAGVGKQTLYRTWPSIHALLFEALATESTESEPVGSHPELFEALKATSAELASEPRSSLLRILAAAVQSDEVIARQFHTALLQPQQEQFARVVAADGFDSPERATELLLAPLLFRWFLRLPPLSDGELADHIETVRRLHRHS
ncbi:TetR/AcrR family transcriptional regulator [Kocuria rhizophila]|uniref:TetR/AcrR family transcriptional regulator n=1 Tax=Kocuria rhizophila TaxID=72000 RepID=UPI0020199CD1|nr:TetR/AcrR family transcriptional regulator [Kocuria rhizophila]